MNQELVRRRFYLSEHSLQYLDNLAKKLGMSSSMLLDYILLQFVEKDNKIIINK